VSRAVTRLLMRPAAALHRVCGLALSGRWHVCNAIDGALLALNSTPDTTHDPCIVDDVVALPPLYACCRHGHQAVAAAAAEAVQHIASSLIYKIPETLT
jgi:hypothetical protein